MPSRTSTQLSFRSLSKEKNQVPLTTLDPKTALMVVDLANVFPRLGETGSTQDILNLLATRSA
jgi:hypothetical protein